MKVTKWLLTNCKNHLQPLLTTEDVQEGVFAMLQKRPPVFKGK